MASIVNLWAVVVAAVISVVLGALWFGPLFGKQWMVLAGVLPENLTPDQQRTVMRKAIGLNILSAIVSATVLGHFLVFASAFTGTSGAAAGLSVGFWAGLGFAAPVLLGGVLWERKPWKWWFIMIGYYFLVYILQGIVFALWR